jgi:hypothetical protein
MVVLNACSSAYETGDEGSSIGAILAKDGIPFVIAMRYDVRVGSAATATRNLYRALRKTPTIAGLSASVRASLFEHHLGARFRGFNYQTMDWLLPVAYAGEARSLKSKMF